MMVVLVSSQLMCLFNDGNGICFCVWVCQPEERLFQESRWVSILFSCLLWDRWVPDLSAADLPKDTRLLCKGLKRAGLGFHQAAAEKM